MNLNITVELYIIDITNQNVNPISDSKITFTIDSNNTYFKSLNLNSNVPKNSKLSLIFNTDSSFDLTIIIDASITIV